MDYYLNYATEGASKGRGRQVTYSEIESFKSIEKAKSKAEYLRSLYDISIFIFDEHGREIEKIERMDYSKYNRTSGIKFSVDYLKKNKKIVEHFIHEMFVKFL